MQYGRKKKKKKKERKKETARRAKERRGQLICMFRVRLSLILLHKKTIEIVLNKVSD